MSWCCFVCLVFGCFGPFVLLFSVCFGFLCFFGLPFFFDFATVVTSLL